MAARYPRRSWSQPGMGVSHPLFILGDMTRQLVLIEDAKLGFGATDWRLDERTREIGRKGVAEAREALREATRRAAA